MADDNNVTIDALCKKLKVARQTVINNINYLKAQGVVRRVGSDKGGHWEIIVNCDSDSK